MLLLNEIKLKKFRSFLEVFDLMNSMKSNIVFSYPYLKTTKQHSIITHIISISTFSSFSTLKP